MRSVAEQLPKANRWKAFVDYMVVKITRPLPPWLPPDPPCIDWVTAGFRIIQAAQNKCEGFNNFARWAYFGADTITQNVRDDQLKIIKYNHLISNLVIFHNCHTITGALKELEKDGVKLTPELLAGLSPYRTHHLNRFGLYEMKERHPLPVDYGVGFET